MPLEQVISKEKVIVIHQRKELAELFGLETRNKYEILGEQGTQIGFAAEQQKGIMGLLFRQWLGHWRRFDIHFFDTDRKPVLIAKHPFRWLFQRLEVFDAQGKYMGAIQQRFGVIRKRLDLEDANGRVVLEVATSVWKIWTFAFERNGQTEVLVEKNWSGLLQEAFTDADKFRVTFRSSATPPNIRMLSLAAAVFIDLQYFERKAGQRNRFSSWG